LSCQMGIFASHHLYLEFVRAGACCVVGILPRAFTSAPSTIGDFRVAFRTPRRRPAALRCRGRATAIARLTDRLFVAFQTRSEVRNYFQSIADTYERSGIAQPCFKDLPSHRIGSRSALATVTLVGRKADGTLVNERHCLTDRIRRSLADCFGDHAHRERHWRGRISLGRMHCRSSLASSIPNHGPKYFGFLPDLAHCGKSSASCH
jgi:hypothetical protein